MQRVTTALCVLTITGLAFTTVSARAVTEIEAAGVERGSDGKALIKWRSVPEGAAIDVSLEFPGARERRLVSDDDRDGIHELSREDAARRPLVILTTAKGEGVTTAERVLPLEGGRNFRDLGGYSTLDGRRVKWGKVFRSGTMTALTDRDYELLSTLNIRVVCDFRTFEERDREPTVWRTSGKQPQYLTRNYSVEASKLREVLGSSSVSAETVRASMLDLYGEIPYEHADSYRAMFKSLAAGDAPLAFNCSAGKDRTGVAAALLLTMLGVPRDTVLDDYAMSERVVNYEKQFGPASKEASAAKPGPWDFIARLPPEVRAPLLRSEPEYIRAALTHIEQKEGSIDAYFERVLNISSNERQAIRNLLLEPDMGTRSASVL